MKKVLTFLAKLIFVGGLLTLLVRKGLLSISLAETGKALGQWQTILPALGIFVLSTILGIVRWHLLLLAQEIRIHFFKTVELAMVGSFFNIALPGAVSGDLVKAFYVGREAKGARARAFGSILFDRIIGLAAMVVIAASAVILSYNTVNGSALLEAVRVVLTVLASGFFLFFLYLFFLDEKRDLVFSFLKWSEKRWSKTGSVLRIYEGIREYHHHRAAVGGVFLLSLFIQILVGAGAWFLAASLGETNIPLLSLYIVVPLGMLVTAVPLLPGGVGTGHAAFGFFFSLLGSQRGADVFTLFVLYNILVGGLGGLIYLRFKSSPDFAQLSKSARAGT